MPKLKEGAGSHGAAKSESVDTLSSYLHMKSPMLGALDFDANLPEPPVDPRMLTYKLNEDAIAYEPSVHELNDAFSAFREFDSGLVCELIDNLGYSSYGIENSEMVDELKEGVAELDPEAPTSLAALRAEMMAKPEMTILQPLLDKARDALPPDVRQLLFDTDDSRSRGRETGRLPVTTNEPASRDHAEAMRERWSSMTLAERINHRIAQINDTFVPVSSLQHPTNPRAKIAKCYKVLPNLGNLQKRYIHAGVDGVTSAVGTEDSGMLAAGGLLHVAKETATQRVYEYYRSTRDSDSGDLKCEPDSQERFSFVRMYSCQQSTKVEGNNYFLLSLPSRLHQKVKSSVVGLGGSPRNVDAMDLDVASEDDDAESAVHILPIKGQKFVLTRAGKPKRPDILLTYTDDASPKQS
ncbi:RNA polymerase II associated Paf1 complex component PAF1 [Babesia caballi]|uniref:RNA polymerase II associated Paf1 complex component PAF1 n=1 Tax=Babesia caballi TaxID=5871 RepID=A0AAV4LR97_BABCB|nr:RNA polymerase II associated Paf1 complex component PAF1 [Babesia caballi]